MTGEAWRRYLQTYVALRRAVGFAMRPEAHLLQDFVEHLERRGQESRSRRLPSSGPQRAPRASTCGG